jgi:hypothetical protein
MAPAGEAWNCPHCGQRILRSAVNCPACQRRLRFDTVTPAQAAASAICPLRVEGTIHHPPTEVPWEYSVLVQVRDTQGAVIARHVVGVGAIQPGDARTFTLQVEMRGPEDTAHAAAAARASAPERKKHGPSSSAPPQEIHASGSHPSERLPGRAE